MDKKKSRILVLAFAVICCGLFIAYRFISNRGRDRTPPDIYVPQGVVCVAMGADESALLDGVTAQDRHDGDVTDLMLVERVSNINEDHRAEVTIAAFDRAGNVAKAKRVVEYEEYTGPRFTLSGPLRFWEKSRIDVFSMVGAEDPVDGDLTDRIKGTLVEGSSAMDQAGDYTVEFRVTNSLGDTSYLKLPVEIYSDNNYVFTMELDEYLVYLKKGEHFDPKAHLKSVILSDRSYPGNALPETWVLQVDSDLDTNTPGVYTVTYTVKLNQYQGCTRLVAVVEE